jgi:hypothetical protein
VTANTALTILWCFSNQLTSLDVSSNTVLTKLYCDNNQLTSLDVSANTALTTLYCHRNQLTSLDVSANTALTELSCYDNQLTSLDVSNYTALTFISCYSNQLTNLDVSSNTALTHLYCYENQLTNLDLSTNTALIYLFCDANQLTSLNVSNGNNINFIGLRAQDNPNLTCIQVDDAAYSEVNWTGSDFIFDPQTSFSEDCTLAPPEITGVPTISGVETEGETLTASPASVSGNPSPTRTWQWKRSGFDISGATSITYVLTSDDVGETIAVAQIETNSAGSDIAESAATGVIQGLEPVNYRSIASGNWNNPGIWTGGAPGTVPQRTDRVTIIGHAVEITENVESGDVYLDNSASGTALRISSGRLQVYGVVDVQNVNEAGEECKLEVSNTGKISIIE